MERTGRKMRRHTIVIVAAILSYAVGISWAQENASSVNLWAWTGAADHHRSVVKVSVGGAVGTGVIVFRDLERSTEDGFMGLGATALHVLDRSKQGASISITYQNGIRKEQAKIVLTNAELDIAFFEVEVPDGITAVPIASKPVRRGDWLEFTGLGGTTNLDELRKFSASASDPTNSMQIFADISLLPGDSGGPLFDRAGNLVGIVSGGWFWFDPSVGTKARPVKATWPARASNVGPLRTMLATFLGCEDEDCLDKLQPPIRHHELANRTRYFEEVVDLGPVALSP